MRVLIIDDERTARNNLSLLIEQYHPNVDIVGYADGVKSGIEAIHQSEPDVVFLDIQMKDGSGFDILASFDTPPFHVVFVTAFDNYALQAFEYNAVDYLLKPIELSRLGKTVVKLSNSQNEIQYQDQLDLLLKSLNSGRLETIVLQTQEGQHYVRLANIMHLHADKNYTTFCCTGRKDIIVSDTIKKYEDLLPAATFFRTHQSHMVHRHHIKSYIKEHGGYIEMADGRQIPISRRKREPFFAWIKQGPSL